MPTYNTKQIYLGNFASFDTQESTKETADFDNELTTVPGWDAGTVFNNSNMRILDVTQNDTVLVEGEKIRSDRLESDDKEGYKEPVPADSFTYDLGSGPVTSKIDSAFLWDATIKLGNGKTENVTASFLQLQNGDVFIPPGTYFPNKDIQSITLIKFVNSDFFGAASNQSADNTRIVCFAAGTFIKTVEGERKIEELTPGDQILTMDMGYQPIRWIGDRKVSAFDLVHFPNLRPICIRAGALAQGCPEMDLIVSPQHRILVNGVIPLRMFDADEVLVAAKHLLELDGIEVVDTLTDVTYFHILLDHHQVIWSNNAATESLYIGGETNKTLSSEQLDEISVLFPELRKSNHATNHPESARLLIKGRQGRNMANRIARNGQALYKLTAKNKIMEPCF